MKTVRGSKLIDLTHIELQEMLKNFQEVVIDVGTGDGRFVYKNALTNPNTFYIGVDPSQSQLEIYAKKSLKDRLINTLYVVGSIEIFPEELFNICDHVKVILPWGTLLQSIVLPKVAEITKLFNLLKETGDLEMVFGYSQDAEPSEVTRLNLNSLDMAYLKENVLPRFMEIGFESATLSNIDKHELDSFESTWSKKLRFGQERPLFHLKLNKKPAISAGSLSQ